MKEPKMVSLYINRRDNFGNEHWLEVELALTEELIEALKEAIQPAPVVINTVDFDKQRIEAYRRFIKRRCVFSGDHKLDFGKIGVTPRTLSLKEASVFHPQDYNALIKELELIDKMEAEAKKEE